jgi:cytochrome P450 PksS
MSVDASVFADPEFRRDPYPTYARMRAASPVSRVTTAAGTEFYAVTRFVDVEAALKDARLVKDIRNARPELRDAPAPIPGGATMLRSDPPEHTRLRSLAHQAFTPRLVNTMREHIQSLSDGLLDAVEPAHRMDLIADFAFPLPVTVICELLGVPATDGPRFRQWSSALITSGSLGGEAVPRIPEVLMLVTYMRDLIQERRAQQSPGDDLIGQLIQARDGAQQLSERELVSTCLLLLLAGHETTVNLIGSGMLALLLNPEQLHVLQNDPRLIRPAVEELLRFVNPVQLVTRFAAEDIEIGGVPIPHGSRLVLLVAAANHDLDFAAGAERLDVTRPVRQHVAFGQGIHYCLGALLARLEGEIAFSTLLRRLPNIRLAADPDQLVWRPGVPLRGLVALPVEF